MLTLNISQLVSIRILHLCEERNLTINKLSTLSGITQSTLNSIINNKSKNPQLKTIAKICCTLEITLKDFFDSPSFDNIFDNIDDL